MSGTARATFSSPLTETQHLREEIELLHEELNTQRLFYQSVFQMDVVQVALENELLKTQLIAAVQEMEVHGEEMKKAKRAIEDLKEKEEDLNEEVTACHGHIRRLKAALKKEKTEVEVIGKDHELLKEKFNYVDALAERYLKQEEVEMLFEPSDDEGDNDEEEPDVEEEEQEEHHGEIPVAAGLHADDANDDEEEIPSDPF
ncbi:hypothetical protein GCK72_000523 [Caenorhabditis remanei]|uniref:Uncharacterized protein n=1 Tax=Caenorhabditis remanei TaxID=31234 RepID=A0A6A5HKK7_CAERE|nr:hypothetical protein GCK72_000523 [Caenorhabditis remanei]KAF1768710.1 hypothetical protein GCK72_000523 [Caenorhabditis remanei]